MAIYHGNCEGCGKDNEIFESNKKCVICTRLDNLEKIVEELQNES